MSRRGPGALKRNSNIARPAHGITPGMIPALAARMSTLNPPPIGGAPTGDAVLGKEIFANGLPDQNVPACSACHGPEARGQREIPRLAGQLYWYMVSTLSIWSSERGQGGRQDISWIMRPTVANLTPKQVQALAEYVSALR
jgi:cytochrome c553